MNHGSVTTTDISSKIELKQVENDFPTIVSNYVSEVQFGKMDTDYIDKSKVGSLYKF